MGKIARYVARQTGDHGRLRDPRRIDLLDILRAQRGEQHMDPEIANSGRDLVDPAVLILNELDLEALESCYFVPGPWRQIDVADDEQRVVDDDDVEGGQSSEAREGIHHGIERVDPVTRQP